MSGTDDERFAEIVAGFGDEPDTPVPPWPVAEDAGDPVPAPQPTAAPLPQQPAGNDDLPGWLEPEALPDDGHFEPPTPPRVPRIRPRTALALGMLLLGLLILFAPFRVGLDDTTPSLLLGVALTTGGAVLLLAWMRDAPPTDSGPDDGAVV